MRRKISAYNRQLNIYPNKLERVNKNEKTVSLGKKTQGKIVLLEKPQSWQKLQSGGCWDGRVTTKNVRVHLIGNGKSITNQRLFQICTASFSGLSNLFDVVLKLAVLLFGEFVESFNTVGAFLQKTVKASVNKTFFNDLINEILS